MNDNGFSVSHITKAFGGTPVLVDVSFDLNPGQVIGLVGHNGAGKSTLLKILAGAYQRDGGTITIDGSPTQFTTPAEALAHGVATVYQELSLIPNLTVTQNMFLGREITRRGSLDKDAMRTRTRALLDEFKLPIDPDAHLSSLPVTTRQLLEIAIATTKNTRYLLLDEPTTSLEGDQVDYLLDYIADLARTKNVGILIVDHKLDELYRVCDRIIALVDGTVRLDADAKRVPHDEVVRAIVGDEAVTTTITHQSLAVSPDTRPWLRCEDLTGPHLNGVTLEARTHEVLGIYGLVGSGRTEFLRTLIGIEPLTSGTITLDGHPYAPKDPGHAARHGIVYLTEERKIDGIIPLMNSAQNAALPIIDQVSTAGFVTPRHLAQRTNPILDSLHIRGRLDGPIEALSGGNQQKVLLGRAIAQNPRLLLLDEPTKGVDIGVKSEIHRILKQMAKDQGIAMVVVSSEEEEIMELSDRIVVFSAGHPIGAPIPATELTVQRLRELAWS